MKSENCRQPENVEPLLDQMKRLSEKRAAELLANVDAEELHQRAIAMPAATMPKIAKGEFGVIAEIKRVAPSAGSLNEAVCPEDQAGIYVDAGAAAISILTEPTRFGAKPGDLEAVVAAVSKPVMRKDFLVHPAQIDEARIAGASGVLLIVKMLDDATLVTLADRASELGMFMLVEAFDLEDIQRAKILEHDYMLGVNSRNLRDLSVDVNRFARVIDAMPADRVAIAESGMTSAADVAKVAALGYDGALIGSALMKQTNPAGLLAEMIQAGRENYGVREIGGAR